MDCTSPIIEKNGIIDGILDVVNDGVVLVNRNFEIVYQNKAFRGKRGGVSGKTCYKTLHGRDLPCDDCVIREVFRDGGHGRRVRRVERQDGAEEWVDISCSPFKDEHGACIGAVEVVRDVTKQKQAEKLLEKALAERNRALELLQGDLSEAAAYVENVLPDPITSGPVRVDWRFVPSASLGGDAFGYHWIDDTHFAIHLMDVSGHGVEAALLSQSIMNVLRSKALSDKDHENPRKVLAELNRTFQGEWCNDMFFTFWYGVYDTSTRVLEYAGAGHPPAFLVSGSPGGEMKPHWLRTRNSALGITLNMRFESKTVTIEPSSRLYVYSDGVYEMNRKDGSIWGFKRFREFMARPRNGHMSILDRLMVHASELTGENSFSDDFTILEADFL